ncbi:hypothetical protein [Xanthomonas maliensis]|uniref:hypothetical protein n=1 Tax=Xanthomonas maliensis TaxID=1321368 RepID=UPI0003A34CD0|nr:hypothetical protein [Xanthomonas maliensis]KAB7764440.1 hypothetical protein CKY51_17565 [Xanthomonas maliensis]
MFEDGRSFEFLDSVEAELIAPERNLVILPEGARAGRDFRSGMDAEQVRETVDPSVINDKSEPDYGLVCATLGEGSSPLR